MSDPPLLHTCGLCIGYRRHVVARDIDLSLHAHETVCLLGGNGAGKSTLFKTLLQLIPPLGGTVYVQGRNAARLKRHELAAVAAYVPQAATEVADFSVTEAVLMGAAARLSWYARPGRAERRLVAESLERLDMTHLAERPLGTLSGGERQLVWIARALVQQPCLLVMDEPTASLDFANQVRVLEGMSALAQQGYAVLFSSHRPEHALQVAHRVLVLHGRRIDSHPPAEFVTAANLAQLYGLDIAQIRKYSHLE